MRKTVMTSFHKHTMVLLAVLAILSQRAMSQRLFDQASPEVRPSGDIAYYEELTYSLWNLQLEGVKNGDMQIRHIQGIVCHSFDDNGNEICRTEYRNRNSGIVEIEIGEDGLPRVANDSIDRSTPAARIRILYGSDSGKPERMERWESDTSAIGLTSSDTLVYDSQGRLLKAGTADIVHSGRNGSYSIEYPDGKKRSFKLDSDGFLVQYSDHDGLEARYSYNEHGCVICIEQEWNNESISTTLFDEYEYDIYGNWTFCRRYALLPEGRKRLTGIIERVYNYR